MKKQKPVKSSGLGFIMSIMKTNWKYFWLCVTAMLINVGLSFVTPKIVGVTVDSVLGQEPFDLPERLTRLIESSGGREWLLKNIYICAGAVMLVTLVSAAAFFCRAYNASKLADFLSCKLRRTLFNHIQTLPFSWHKNVNTGDIIQRCSSDVDAICNFVSTQFTDVIRIILMITVAYSLMFSINVGLALICLAFVPIILIYSSAFYKKIAINFKAADEAEGRLHAAAQENFTGVRVVRAFGNEKYEMEKFETINQSFSDLWIKTGRLLGLYWSLGDFISSLQTAVLVICGTVFAVRGRMTPGEIMIFMMYGGMLSWPLRRLGRTLGEMSKAGVSIERLNEIICVGSEKALSEGICPEINGHIKFENVSFGFGNEAVLKNVSFEVKPGQTLAILGGTGSGKSTLLNLLTRLYELPEGSGGAIYIDGNDIRKINARYLRKNIAAVLQEPFLFSDSIINNILIAAPRAGRGKAESAARDADIHETVTEFEAGYDTVIGEKGVTLSGGQRQRLAITRALVCEAPIIIFDDSLSAVDVQTDSRIRAALKKRDKDAVKIIVSHRISTLADADIIMVLDGGRVTEIGSHDELLKKNGIYRSVYDIQSLFESEVDREITETPDTDENIKRGEKTHG